MHIYVRVVKVSTGEKPFKVQLSPDRLRWVIMAEFAEFEPAKANAQELSQRVSPDQPQLIVTHILWKNR